MSTVMLCFYLEDPANFALGNDLAMKIATMYNIRSMMCTSQQLHAEAPQNYVPFASLESVITQLMVNRFYCIISDKVIDINQPSLQVVGLVPEQNVLFFNGKRYDIHSQLDGFVASVIKALTKFPVAYKYDTHSTFHFASEGDTNQFSVAPITDPFDLTNLPVTVRPLWNFTDEPTLQAMWKQFLSSRVRFVSAGEHPQVNVVINAANQMTDPTKTIYFCMEPKGEQQYGAYLSILNAKNNLMFLGLHKYHLNNAEWHLSPTISQLRSLQIVKQFDKVLSVVVSSKAQDPGHIYRLALIKEMDRMSSEGNLPFELHIYGRCAALNFKNYRGELPDHQKDAALFPYKYHLNVENHYDDNYITEKLYDSVCAECFTFYKGAGNVHQFFDANSVLLLSGDMSGIKQDISLISSAMLSGKYETSITSIRKDKLRILTQYAFEPRVYGIVRAVKTVVYVASVMNLAYARTQGFKDIHTASIPFNLVKIAEEACEKNVPLLVLMSDTQHSNLFDRVGFFISAAADSQGGPTPDILSFRDPSDGKLDIFILPKACEKIVNNVKQQRHFFADIAIVNA